MLEMLLPVALGIGLPLVLSLAGLWFSWRRSPSRTQALDTFDPFRAGLLSAVLLGVVLTLGVVSGAARPHFPPTSSLDWPVHFAWLGGLVGVVGALLATSRPQAPPRRAGLAVFLLLHVFLAGLVLGTMRHALSGAHAGVAWATALGVSLVGAGISLAWRAAATHPGPIVPLLVVLVGTTSALSTVLTGNIGSPMLYGTMCACVGPAFLVGLRRPGLVLAGALTGPAWLLSGLCVVTTVYGETPWWCAGLNALAAIMVYLSGVGALGRAQTWRVWLVRGVMVGVPGVASVVVALLNQPEPYVS